MKQIIVFFLLVFGLFHNEINAQSTSTINHYSRNNNRITAQPLHIYKISLQLFENKKELTNRITNKYNSISVFFPSDSILIIQSSASIDENQLIQTIKNKTNTIYNYYYKYFNGEMINKNDSIVKHNKQILKKR